MTNLYKILTLIVCAALFGCGSGSSSGGNSSGSSPSNATTQAGQWEFVATPTSGLPVLVEANLTVSGNSVTSPLIDNELFQPNGSTFSACTNLIINGSLSQGILSFTMSNTAVATFSGAAIASDGKSVSGGSYTAQNLCGLVANQSSGTFTGYAVAPLNGTFVGTITGSGQPQQITLHITQDANFGLTVSGTSIQSGTTSTIAISPNSNLPFNVDIRGAFVYANGTSTSVNGSTGFTLLARINATATQITILDQSGVQSGTLTKQ
jgi:hypothetical protein